MDNFSKRPAGVLATKPEQNHVTHFKVIRLYYKTIKRTFMNSRFTLITIALSFFSTSLLFSQSFTATVVDAQTGTPIPFATIQTGDHSGTLTNEEGVFSLTEWQVERLRDSIFVSSMGYEKIGFLLSEESPNTFRLKSETFVLDEVLLSNKNYTAEEIIDKVKENLEANYRTQLSKWEFFFRQSDLSKVEKMDFQIEESTIEELNQELMDELSASIPDRSDRYRETAGTFYGNVSQHKLKIKKAADLYDASKDVSVDEVTERMERIFKENVKPDSYLKIKSGIVGTKVELDSSDTNNAVTIERDTIKEEKVHVKSVNRHLDELFSQLFYFEDTELDFIEKSNRYRWSKEGYTLLNGNPVYRLKFTPKGGRDFEGTVFVNIEDYAIVRLDFNNVKPTNRFGLFGITYRRNVLRGKMLFVKEASGSYRPQYLELEDGELVGVDRPLKVIEKNKHVKGRRKQNELDMDLNIKINSLTKYEFVVFESEGLNEADFEAVTEDKKVQSTTLKAYDPTFWDGYTIMEPNQAIQAFRVIE